MFSKFCITFLRHDEQTPLGKGLRDVRASKFRSRSAKVSRILTIVRMDNRRFHSAYNWPPYITSHCGKSCGTKRRGAPSQFPNPALWVHGIPELRICCKSRCKLRCKFRARLARLPAVRLRNKKNHVGEFLSE